MGCPILVVCEGASEVNYIRLLNRLLCSADGRAVFVSKDANGGSPGKIIKTLKQERKQNRKIPIWIFLDEDIYVRDSSLQSNLLMKKGDALVQFSRMNFEDVIMLHESSSTLMEWIQVCRRARHFSSPLSEEEYFFRFKKFFPDYRKRELPFELTNCRLNRAFANLKIQKEIQSALLLSIEQLIQSKEIVFRYSEEDSVC